MNVYKLVARLKNNVVRLEKIVLSSKDLPVEEKFVAGEDYPLSVYQDLMTIMGKDYDWFMENHTIFFYETVDYALITEPEVKVNPVIKNTITIDAYDLRLKSDTHDELSDYLQVSNGSSHRWYPKNDYFKFNDEVNAALVALGVDLNSEIYLKFSW